MRARKLHDHTRDNREQARRASFPSKACFLVCQRARDFAASDLTYCVSIFADNRSGETGFGGDVVSPGSSCLPFRLLQVPMADCPARGTSNAQVVSLHLPIPVAQRPAANHRRLSDGSALRPECVYGPSELAQSPTVTCNGLNHRRFLHDSCRSTYSTVTSARVREPQVRACNQLQGFAPAPRVERAVFFLEGWVRSSFEDCTARCLATHDWDAAAILKRLTRVDISGNQTAIESASAGICKRPRCSQRTPPHSPTRVCR